MCFDKLNSINGASGGDGCDAGDAAARPPILAEVGGMSSVNVFIIDTTNSLYNTDSTLVRSGLTCVYSSSRRTFVTPNAAVYQFLFRLFFSGAHRQLIRATFPIKSHERGVFAIGIFFEISLCATWQRASSRKSFMLVAASVTH